LQPPRVRVLARTAVDYLAWTRVVVYANVRRIDITD
jgi:hypothetical protein